MKNYFKLCIAVFAFVLLTNCEKEEGQVQVLIKEFSEIQLIESTFEEVQKENEFIELKGKTKTEDFFNNTITKSSGNSNEIKVVKESVNKITREDYISYTFLIENENNSSAFYENLVMEKRQDTVNAYIITFEPSEAYLKSENLPFEGKMSIRSTEYDASILKNATDGECYWVNTSTRRDCTEHGTGGINNPKCVNNGKSAMVYSSKLMCFGGKSISFDSDDSIWNPNNDSNNVGGNNEHPETNNSPVSPCGDARRGCGKRADILSSKLSLNGVQRDWLRDQNEFYISKIEKFLDNKGDTPETREEAKLTIEVESEKNKLDDSKKGTVRGRSALKYKSKGKIWGGMLYELETGELLFESSTIRPINKGDALFQTSESNGPYFYIYTPFDGRWSEFIIDKTKADCLTCDINLLLDKLVYDPIKFAGRYVTPAEDIIILIDGKDIDNNEASRIKAAGFLLLTIVPGSKALKVTTNVAEALAIATKVGSKTIVINGIKGIRSFTSANFRHNLGKITKILPSTHQAHHVLPQKFRLDFNKAGINIDNPLFGSWWEKTSHLKKASEYNDAWKTFFINNKNPTQDEIFDFARGLGKKYNLEIYF